MLNDDNGYNLATHALLVLMTVWGGLVTYMLRVHKEKKAFLLRDALKQLVVSGFVGMLTMLLCWHFQLPVPAAGFMAGMSGYMGSKTLDLFESRASKFFGGEK